MVSEVCSYFVMSFTSLAPLINPPGSAIELLGIIGLGDKALYQCVARKVAVNTAVLLAATGIAGPYLMQCFGISLGILQLMGGLLLAALAWGMLHKDEPEEVATEVITVQGDKDAKSHWLARGFYPLTYPITVGPCSVAVMLSLSVQARSLVPTSRMLAGVGVMLCLLLMSVLIYLCYSYAPLAGRILSPGIVTGLTRIVPFLVLCVGAQLAWSGIVSLHKSLHP